ncbi:MAG: EscN/YscN/HrcN family type III secretion system ATPase, partial [Verrucomicrobiales bacterium]|nr:EscN/YscN/HrcN family type III secretion system ATPase [Verrucomicrobiales bacterium]
MQLIGLVIESEGPLCAVGEVCRIESAAGPTLAEVVGFRDHHVLLMPLGDLHGIHPGSEVTALGRALSVPVGDALKGRVIDGLGQPLDGRGPLQTLESAPLKVQPPHPLKRQR